MYADTQEALVFLSARAARAQSGAGNERFPRRQLQKRGGFHNHLSQPCMTKAPKRHIYALSVGALALEVLCGQVIALLHSQSR